VERREHERGEQGRGGEPVDDHGGKRALHLAVSLKLRQVSAGGSNGCELELNALAVLFTRHMAEAVQLAWDAMPEPRLVVAFGACALSGGLYAASPEPERGFLERFPASLLVPGCPPRPLTFVSGILDMLGIRGTPAAAARTHPSSRVKGAGAPDCGHGGSLERAAHQSDSRLRTRLRPEVASAVGPVDQEGATTCRIDRREPRQRPESGTNVAPEARYERC
jgi:Ni,Fe-hydrogenase III small subunit